MKKRILSILLTFMMILSVGGFTLVASAEDPTVETDGVYSYLVTDGKATIVACDQSISGDVTIPQTLGGYPVTAIDSGAFYNCQGIKSITIPDNIKTIGYDAFYNCAGLTTLTVGNGVTVVDEYSFSCCLKLTSVTLGSNVESIMKGAFEACEKLSSITLPKSVTFIDCGAFAGCAELKDVFYAGSKSAKSKIKVAVGNSEIEDAVWHYNATLKATKLNGAKITVKDQTYNGTAKKPSVKVVLGGKTLKKGTDYTVSYKNNKNIGKATVTVKGKGNYSGSVKKTFKINPKKVKSLKLKSSKKKQLTVSWKKDSKVTGYKIVYATNKKFTKGKKTVTVKSAKTVKKTIKKLKSKKTYYVKVRAYKTVKGTKYYGAYTSAKKLKIK